MLIGYALEVVLHSRVYRHAPVTLVFTSVGYEREEAVVRSEAPVQVGLNTGEIHGTEVVVAASRVAESILKSPVSVERLDSRSIRNSPAPSFYDIEYRQRACTGNPFYPPL